MSSAIEVLQGIMRDDDAIEESDLVQRLLVVAEVMDMETGNPFLVIYSESSDGRDIPAWVAKGMIRETLEAGMFGGEED